jgi:hypothetical protein
MINSRQRRLEYINMFAIIDEQRVITLKRVVNATIENIDKEESEEQEQFVDMEFAKVEFLNQIADNIIVAIAENGELDG